MWREFTHEKPARRGLALVISALALLAAMILAWLTTTGALKTPHRRNAAALVDWPISFTLPDGYRWSRSAVPRLLEQPRADSAGLDTFVGRRRGGGPTIILSVSFGWMPEGDCLKGTVWEALATDGDDGEPVQVGPVIGWMTKKDVGDAGSVVVGIGCLPDGLSVAVACLAATKTEEATRILESTCRSIAVTAGRADR